MLNTGIVKALSLCAVMVLVAACSAAPRKVDSYTSSSGAVMDLPTDRQSCVGSCNADFDRCSDTRAAESQVGRGQLTGVFGAQADCKSDMRACLSRCKDR